MNKEAAVEDILLHGWIWIMRTGVGIIYEYVRDPVLFNFNRNRKVINVRAGTSLSDFKLMVQNVYGIPVASQ